MPTDKKNITTKFYLISLFITIFLIAIIVQVIIIQYQDGDKYKQLSTELTVKRDTIHSNKGNIYASDGNLLATSISRYTIYMDVVTAINNGLFDKNVLLLSKELSKMLGKSTQYYLDKLRKAKNDKNRYLLIAKNISRTQYIKIKEFPIFKQGPYKGGFIANHKKVRTNLLNKIAQRTIGYDDNRGKVGIEGAYSKYLKGKNGYRYKQKIAKSQWKTINSINQKDPIDGLDIITTIDLNIQDITHHTLLKNLEYYNAEHGCAVVMETKTGNIKAISNLGATTNGKYYEKRNYAVWEANEPGSTFKLAGIMAALDDKLIDTSTVVDTKKGLLYINNQKIEDTQKGGNGKISAAKAFELSSNIGIVKIMSKHYHNKPQKFYQKLEKYGFTKPIGFQIKGEGIPVVPNPKNKNSWNKTSLEWMAWGYGISVTPMQTLMFYNAVANNGIMVKPKFIKALKKQQKTIKNYKIKIKNPKIASDETLKKVRKILKNVIVRGTAKNIYSPHFSIAGKTGTVKKYIPKTKDSLGNYEGGYYSTNKYISSFVGYFPADNPKYSCIVVIHEPNKEKGYYGSAVAAPIFKEIAQKIYIANPDVSTTVSEKVNLKDIEKTYDKFYNDINKKYTKIPDVKGMPGMDALVLLESIGLKVKVKGIGKVTSQSLKKGEKLIKGKTIVLKLS